MNKRHTYSDEGRKSLHRLRIGSLRFLLTLLMTVGTVAGNGQLSSAAQTVNDEIEDAVAFGDSGTVGDFSLTLNSVDFDATTAVLLENPLNNPPAVGFRFVLVSAEVTYIGPDSANVDYGLLVSAITGSGEFAGSNSTDACGSVSGGASSLPKLESGQTERLNICWNVAEEDVDSLIIRAYSQPQTVWFSLGNVLPDFVPNEIADDVARESTRDNPVSFGSSGLVGDFVLSMIAIEADATERVAAFDAENRVPGPGQQYFLVRVRAIYVGDNQGYPAGHLKFRLIDANDAVYIFNTGYHIEVPDEVFKKGSLLPGGEFDFNLCWLIESNSVDSLQFQIVDRHGSDESGLWLSLDEV